MIRSSTGDLAARLVWLLMDKCSFLNQGTASTPCGYGNRKWKETTLYWQTHYWPCRGSKNNDQGRIQRRVLPSRIIAAGSARFLGHDGDWVGWINKTGYWILMCWDNWVRSKGILNSTHLWVMDVQRNWPLTSLIDSHMLFIYRGWSGIWPSFCNNHISTKFLL